MGPSLLRWRGGAEAWAGAGRLGDAGGLVVVDDGPGDGDADGTGEALL